MNTEPTGQTPSRLSLLRNWTSLTGLMIVVGSFFAFLLLFAIDSFAHLANPYIGVLIYLVAPCFTVMGLLLTAFGAWRERRQIVKSAGAMPAMVINLSRPRDRRILNFFIAGSALFLLITAMGSYHSYHFTESVKFCGQTCHVVMEPELTSYQHSPHARVSCAECHIGPGATWYVRSKLSGAYQVYATIAKKYPRPIPTPVKNLRPAQETCEQCHWPKQFVGNVDRTFTSFLGDKTNPVYSVRMLLKVGGADSSHGPEGGIHWHMNVANMIEYVATDEPRQTIPWVRLTDAQGVVTEFRSPKFTNSIAGLPVRRMDCMDCHNRPAHMLESPNDAVNLAMALGKIDTSLPFIKTNAVFALIQPYANGTEAAQKIATFLANQYPGEEPKVRPTIAAVQNIYKENFFPEMNASWKVYPDNIGHKDWPGCFRCHDGKHQTADGKKTIKANDCNACHLILAQGSGEELEGLTARGQEFKHPGDEYDKAYLCNDCHNGGL
jgi:nitrate/TMAO reductase-like tetraheme cytochrome c subunit